MCFVCERIQMISDGNNPYLVKELETGYVVIGDHQYFHGYTVFICKKHVEELFELEETFRQKHLEEMVLVSEAVYRAFKAEKMNYELLGNGNNSAHIHWHLFPRRKGDMPTLGPVWKLSNEIMYAENTYPTETELQEMKQLLMKELESLLL